jgi:hypothetical protein
VGLGGPLARSDDMLAEVLRCCWDLPASRVPVAADLVHGFLRGTALGFGARQRRSSIRKRQSMNFQSIDHGGQVEREQQAGQLVVQTLQGQGSVQPLLPAVSIEAGRNWRTAA